MGKILGILLNPTLRSTIEEVLALPQATDGISSNLDDADTTNTDESTKDATSTNTNVCSTPAASLARVKNTKLKLSSCPFSIEEATSLLEATCDNFDTGDASASIPLEQIDALKLLISSSTDQTQAKQILASLENAIQPSTILFERKPVTSTNSTDVAFQKRMAYLRQLQEERSYLSSTSNLAKLNAHNTRDDVNVKSMMYATSVGLNMIVAPISFGVFMYFFAGSLFSKFFPLETRSGEIDIRQVIAGVISGVILLFIEMILFVIRSHELDKSVRRKGKMKGYRSNPFGYVERAMEKTYNGEMD